MEKLLVEKEGEEHATVKDGEEDELLGIAGMLNWETPLEAAPTSNHTITTDVVALEAQQEANALEAPTPEEDSLKAMNPTTTTEVNALKAPTPIEEEEALKAQGPKANPATDIAKEVATSTAEQDEMEVEDQAAKADQSVEALEPEKSKTGTDTDRMDVVDPTANPVFDPAIMVVPAGQDWDEAAEVAAAQVDLPMDLPIETDATLVKPRSLFYSGTRRVWVGQRITDGKFVSMLMFPNPEIIKGKELARRYLAWMTIQKRHPELEMTAAFDIAVGRNAVFDMLEAFGDEDTLEGARNGLAHWLARAYNIDKRKRREAEKALEEERQRRRDQDRVDLRHKLLHSRNAKLEQTKEVKRAPSRFPHFMRALEPIEEEIDSLEKATGHFKAQLADLLKKPMVKEAKKGQAYQWPARHSDPMSVSQGCPQCGKDGHSGVEKCAFSEVKDEEKLRRSVDLPEDAKAEAEDNVYVAMYLADKAQTSTARCDYALCEDRSAHLTAACPTLHARCSACQFRGHRAETKLDGRFVCTKKPEGERHFAYRTTALLGVAFEKAADAGRYTKHRKQFPAAGFYPCIGKAEEGLLAIIGYEVVFRVGTARTRAYLDGCRKAAQDAFGMDLVHEVVGTRYQMSREDELAEYDNFITEFARAYAGMMERSIRKADLRALQAEELEKIIRRNRDQRDLTKASAHLHKVREDIWVMATQQVTLLTQDARVITGVEPVDKTAAVARLAPAVRAIYRDRETEKSAVQEARPVATTPTTPRGSYAGVIRPQGPRPNQAPVTRSPTAGSSTALLRPTVPPRAGPSGEPERKKSRRQGQAEALVEAYRAHQRHAAGGSPPTEAVNGLVSGAEFRRLTPLGHQMFEALASGRFYDRKGQLPRLSERELDSLPRAMRRIPSGGVWRNTDFRNGEVYQIGARFFYLRNAYGEWEFNPQDTRLPGVVRRRGPEETPRGQRRDGSGGRSGRGRSGSSSGRSRQGSGDRRRY